MKGIVKWLATRAVPRVDALTARHALAAVILLLAALGVLQAADVQVVLHLLGLSAL